MNASVISVSRSPVHGFSKHAVAEIEIVAGLGVAGDAHAGVTVRHRYLVKKNPHAPNLCQVHLLQAELFDELAAKGFSIAAGQLGENVTTVGVDLLHLPVGTRVHLGDGAVVQLTGLRTPCQQMNGLQPGLMQACLARTATGATVRKAGVMGIAVVGGPVRHGDAIRVELPAGEHRPLGPV